MDSVPHRSCSLVSSTRSPRSNWRRRCPWLLRDPRVTHVEVDVALVEFCDSGGLSALMAAALLAADRHVLLNLVQIRLPLQRILEATKLSRLLCPPE
ncbi:STAS domain-containing protein [Streptacidiphilus sp. 4-A2]|nr:STAS domain-containing protein [Streptacidiphilus sp. 4-A2]